MMSSCSDSDSYESDDTGTRAIKLPSQTREKRRKLGARGGKSEDKAAVAAQKAAKLAQKVVDSMYKPGECMKHMYVEIHPDFLKFWYAADIAAEVCATGAQIKPTPELCDVNIVMWSRRSNQALQVVDGKVILGPEREHCDRCLLVMTGHQLLALMHSEELSQHLTTIVSMTGCSTTLVLIGAKDYVKKNLKKAPSDSLTEVQLEMAFTDILVSTGCDSMMVNTPNELARLIVQFTKSIAEKPFKEAKYATDDQVEFFMRGDNKKCVAVDGHGYGMSRVWQQMLAVLPQSSLELSRAVAVDCPSPQTLYEILESPDGVTTIADIGVTRAAVPGARARRVGPEFARKLKLLFTASDGNILLD